jgi:hypothetical protein
MNINLLYFIRSQIEEFQELVTELEKDKGKLLKKIAERDRQLKLYVEQLTQNKKQIEKLQTRLDKVQFVILGKVKLIIWFSDTDFQKNDEGGRVFNFLYLYAYWSNL